MQLINQHTKAIMEGCKERARAAGLRFDDESLEYIVTNRDMLELSPKNMIPTLYDYWVHDVEVLKEKGKYELYPGNPYETVINTRPAISFYNDNNPDWLNVMIFYHVLAHIDFFQNNVYFRHTWDYDLTGQALADKRLISRLRSEKGHWVDYIIEFARSIDNLVGYFQTLCDCDRPYASKRLKRLDFYFDVFLQNVKKVKINNYLKEIDRYNECLRKHGTGGEAEFFAGVLVKYPEFETIYNKGTGKEKHRQTDILKFLLENSEFLARDENKWMLSILQIIRNTSIYFQPQIRTKIMNEGWASYWHEKLFLEDERIVGHEVDFSRVNAGVTALPRVGLNPYALGLRLFQYIEAQADKGKISLEFQSIAGSEERRKFDRKAGGGKEFIFDVRKNLADFLFINNFVDQDFVTGNDLFVAGRRLNQSRMVWEYYVKSRKAADYREMLLGSLYHPPSIAVDIDKTSKGPLYLNHKFEGKPLVQEFIPNTLIGIEFLWGRPVELETSEAVMQSGSQDPSSGGFDTPPQTVEWRRVLYHMEERKLTKTVL